MHYSMIYFERGDGESVRVINKNAIYTCWKLVATKTKTNTQQK